MKITFLGTGTSQGIPVINSDHPVCLSSDKKDKRLRVSVLIQWNNWSYVIDCGPDFRYQMLRARVSKLDGILFTHEHADHVAGLDDIRPFVFQAGPMSVFAHLRVLNDLRIRFNYIFRSKNKYPGAPSVIENELNGTPFKLAKIYVKPIELMHGKLPVFGYRFNDFAYLTDVKTIDSVQKEKLLNLKVLVVGVLRLEPHHAHLNLEEALQLIEELKPEKTYITHISHKLGFHEEVQNKLPKNVFLAYDELVIEV